MTTAMPSKPEGPKVPVVRPGSGRAMVVGGLMVGAGLVGFYMNLRRNQAKKEEQDTIPHYERLMAHVGSTSYTDEDPAHLPASRVEARSTTLPAPLKEHKSGHSTIANFKSSPGYSDNGRREQPAPQRARADGSNVVYTKSPDYVKGYKREPEATK
ncbi:hypothetical protein BDZ94DRAFT_1247604 [Collybia nuda]|uniref:Uncharacterized protein n=1 Tax=Collybia nuda TaxID=64659 RepID=A0A9P6CPJ8_9AGAR|nr:hypothetical protein BDZ94DRAFT_1247604 [Collybia nuda]